MYSHLSYQLSTKYSIELNIVFKIMDVLGLTLPSLDISSKVTLYW